MSNTVTATLETELIDTFAYEVDDYNTICRSSTEHQTEYLISDESHQPTDFSFESMFADKKTLKLFTKLLDHARRSKHTVSFPYRCDTDKACNFYRLTISISTARHILFYNRLLGMHLRPQGVIWNRSLDTGAEAFYVCSICNKIKQEDQWVYFQDMVDLNLWPAADREMLYASTVCAACESGIEQRIHQSKVSMSY